MSFNVEVVFDSTDDVAVEIVKTFIESNPTKLNESFEASPFVGTLLHFSCLWNRPKVVSYLLSKNADITICFEESLIAQWIRWAIRSETHGLTAKQIAEKKGYGNIVILFEQYQREQAEKEQAEREQAEREQAERERAEKEQAEKEQAEKEREQAEREQAKKEREQAEREQAEREQAKREREQAEREQAEREKIYQFLKQLQFDDTTIQKIEKYGVRKVEDFVDFGNADWANLGIPPFQQNRIINKISNPLVGQVSTSKEESQGKELHKEAKEERNTKASIPVTEKNPMFDHIATRVMDVSNEPSQILNPIIGLLDIPLCSFDETLQSLEHLIPGIENFSFTCTLFANNINNNKKQNLSDDEISSINLYTCESNPRENSLYFVLNKALREKDRMALKPFFPYLHLLLHSMCKLPKCSPGTVLWRGVQKNISSDYTKGKKIIWWGLSSCTKDMNALDTFLGKDSDRTLFSVQINSAIEISQFSAFPNEEEVLVFPCVTFEVQNVYSPSKNLWIVQLKEIFSPVKLIKGFDFLGM